MGIELVLPQSRSGKKRILNGNVLVLHLKNEENACITVSLCKYLSTAGLREQNINMTQSWLGILESSFNLGTVAGF